MWVIDEPFRHVTGPLPDGFRVECPTGLAD